MTVLEFSLCAIEINIDYIGSRGRFNRSKANEWNNATMALRVFTLLEEVLTMWMELTEEEQDYKEAKKQMVAKMAPMTFVSLDNFHQCKLQPAESVSVLTRILVTIWSCISLWQDYRPTEAHSYIRAT